MKKLSLLVALGLFTLGSATLVNANPDGGMVEGEAPAVEGQLEGDINGDGFIDEDEQAILDAASETSEDSVADDSVTIPVEEAPAE